MYRIYPENVVIESRRHFENELDFSDQELLVMNRCRNAIDKIGETFIILSLMIMPEYLIKMRFYRDAEPVEFRDNESQKRV